MNAGSGDHHGWEDGAASDPDRAAPSAQSWLSPSPSLSPSGHAALTGPGAQDDGPAQRARLQHGQRMAELTLEQLWLRFFALGGDAGLVELEAYLAGLMPLPARQRDLLAQAVNERLDELLLAAKVPYTMAVLATPDASAELSGLVGLLAGSHLAPPDLLPALASTAYRSLGVDVRMYLVDHEQLLLVPALARSVESAAAPQSLSIEATLGGRAFRQVETVVSDAPGHSRLWLPLLDGTERLGVLEVQLPDTDGLHDVVLRQQCEHLASLIGHLVTTLGERGDALDTVRRNRPRAPSAELVWQLLPPPTAETDAFALSGWLQPADVVGGDTFDYALSAGHASMAVFDAMGHGLPAGLMAAAAVSSYRAARRNGQDLQAQARAVDAAVGALNADGNFVTGFLGELDLVSGRLTYLSAGHPQPLLLRGGKVVRALGGGRRVPFGLDLLARHGPPAADDDGGVGREDLEPGDWLVVHSDGVTEARDEAGEFFGDARLADFLERAAAAGHPPPETARRLAHAVLAHQHGQLQDDATVLLSCWHPR